MRLLSIRLCNLNSLRGTHEVRFDVPPLAGCGVFLIAGPTGAGKSTILDALTLALYGRAARYGKASPDEMMSRHTAECFAEVEFEGGGHAYRAVWRMWRAHGKAGGKLQPVERRLVSLGDHRPLAEKSLEVDTQIEALTGLDYDRFLRSVLLAQGQFEAFLRARASERAMLLEKITGTEIYSALSQLAHAEHGSRQQAVERLRFQIASRPVLSDDARSVEEKAFGSAQASVAECAAEVKTARAAFEMTEKDIAGHLEAARAAETANAFAKAAAELATQLATHAPALEAAAEAARAAAAERLAREPLWKEVVELDAIVTPQSLAAATAAAAATQAQAALATAREARARARQSLERERQMAESIRAELLERAGDLTLGDALPALREAAEAWREAVQARVQGEKLVEVAALWSDRADLAAAAVITLDRELAAARARHSSLQALMEELGRERDAQRHVVDHALRVQGLSEHRRQLLPGEACPLCGSPDHPFASASAADQLATQSSEARRRLEALESSLASTQKEVTALVRTIGILKASGAGEKETEQSARSFVRALAPPGVEELAALQDGEAKCAERARKGFHHWGLTLERSEETTAVLGALQERAQAISVAEKKNAEAEHALARAGAVLTAAQVECERAEAALRHAETEAAETAKKLEACRGTRLALFGDTVVDDDRAHFEQRVRETQTTLETALQAETQLKTEQSEARARRDEALRRKHDLDVRLEGRTPPREEVRAQIRQTLETLETTLTARHEEVGLRRQTLKFDDEARAGLKSATAELATAQAELARWNRLRELIGSGDGGKFSRFAQILTLRQLINRANGHLLQLAPRYRLFADEGGEWDLRIVDLFQANVDRPLESLSGGESFLASLALALGLSELASRRHSIDSLFIDEGFGTLDAETLEVALAALENLQARGKTIGLVSHVEALRERLGVRIEVTRGPDGTSSLRVVA